MRTLAPGSTGVPPIDSALRHQVPNDKLADAPELRRHNPDLRALQTPEAFL